MPGNFKTIPLAVLQSWPAPNYMDPVRRTYMPAFVLTWQIASTILVSGRLYVRAKKQAGGFGLDDVMILIGWVFSVGFTTTAWLDTERYNLDRHTWDVHSSLYTGAAMVGWIAQIMFICSTVPTKLSVLFFYRRMVQESLAKRWVYAIYLAIFVTAGYGLAIFIVYFLTCQPLDALWKAYDPTYDEDYTCVNGNAFTLTIGICSVLSDIYAVALPCLILRHYELKAPRRQKIALNLIFAMGFLVAGAGMARTYYLWRVNSSYDTSWNGFDLFLWSTVECQLVIIIACTPSCRAFFRHYLRDNLKRTFGSSVSYYGGGSNQRPVQVEGFSHLADSRRDVGKDIEAGAGSDGRSLSFPPSMGDSHGHSVSWETFVATTGTSDTLTPHTQSTRHDGVRIQTAEEYELYAVERLNRHGSMVSKVNLDLDVGRDVRRHTASSRREKGDNV